MSDDEEITYIKKQKTIHYGSLEDQERIRLGTLSASETDGEPKVGGNIHVSNGNCQYSVIAPNRLLKYLEPIYVYINYMIIYRIFRFGGCNIKRQTSSA